MRCWDQGEFDSHTKMAKVQQGLVITCVFFFMLGVGMQMDLETAKIVARKRWKAPAVGLVGQIFINPFAMFLILAVFGPDMPVNAKLAAVLVACSPGGNGPS